MGALTWPAIHSHLDLACSVGVLARFFSNTGPTHVELVQYLSQYVAGTLELGLTFDREKDSLDVVGYIDSDFAGSQPDRKSTRGYVFMFAGAAISHLSKLQSLVA